jgi:hypothetical protein
MPLTEKGRQNGDPIPNAVPWQDSAESSPQKLRLQIFCLARRLSINAPLAEALAPLVYGGLLQ